MFLCHLFLQVCGELWPRAPHTHELRLTHELHPRSLHAHGHPTLEVQEDKNDIQCDITALSIPFKGINPREERDI